MTRLRPSAYMVEIKGDDAKALHLYQEAQRLGIVAVRPVFYSPGVFVMEVSAFDVNRIRKAIKEYERTIRQEGYSAGQHTPAIDDHQPDVGQLGE